MNLLADIFSGYLAQTAALSWFLAQLMKFLIEFVRNDAIRWERMVGSGGFPSSHTSLVIGMSTAIGLTHGFSSDLFVISLVFSLVIMYDASGVRLETGRQAQVLNQIIDYFEKKNITVHRGGQIILKELLGHTPFEVFGGFVLGVLVASGLYYIRFV